MGFDFNTTKFVLFARSLGVDLSSTITLGRQILFIHEKELGYLLRGFAYDIADAEIRNFYKDASIADGKYPYVEYLLRYLGAGKVDPLDASGYEGATVIHDMSQPIDTSSWSRYSVVIDGGTLEHIFDLPPALQNRMKLLEKGGHFISIGPADNWLGHGMYQFSPELFHRVSNQSNGFRTKGMFLSDVKSRRYWYEIPNPDERLALVTSSEVYLMVVAEKISEPATIQANPQQAYYEDKLWAGEDDTKLNKWLVLLGRIKDAIPVPIINMLVPLRARLEAIVARPYDIRQLRRFDALERHRRGGPVPNAHA